MKRTLAWGMLLLLAAGAAAWGLPDYEAQSGYEITGVTVSPAAGPGSAGTTWYTIDIASDAAWFSGESWLPVTGVAGLAVYPNAGQDYGGTVDYGNAHDSWQVQPPHGSGSSVSAFGWLGMNEQERILTPDSGSTGPITIGSATYSEAPPDAQYLLHVIVQDGNNVNTKWGKPTGVLAEPASAALLGLGVAGFVALRRRKRASA